jgi:hypothetical protein
MIGCVHSTWLDPPAPNFFPRFPFTISLYQVCN